MADGILLGVLRVNEQYFLWGSWTEKKEGSKKYGVESMKFVIFANSDFLLLV